MVMTMIGRVERVFGTCIVGTDFEKGEGGELAEWRPWLSLPTTGESWSVMRSSLRGIEELYCLIIDHEAMSISTWAKLQI